MHVLGSPGSRDWYCRAHRGVCGTSRARALSWEAADWSSLGCDYGSDNGVRCFVWLTAATVMVMMMMQWSHCYCRFSALARPFHDGHRTLLACSMNLATTTANDKASTIQYLALLVGCLLPPKSKYGEVSCRKHPCAVCA